MGGTDPGLLGLSVSTDEVQSFGVCVAPLQSSDGWVHFGAWLRGDKSAPLGTNPGSTSLALSLTPASCWPHCCGPGPPPLLLAPAEG